MLINVLCLLGSIRTQQTMLGSCWGSIVDGGPTLTHHWVNVLYFVVGRGLKRRLSLAWHL